MPEKLSPYKSYGEKLISLFARLMFSDQSHSLTELSKMFKCSKQTVLRLVNDIQRSYGVDIEESMQGNKRYYRIKTLRQIPPAINLTEMEMNVLRMCKAFSEHLLGKELFKEATRALEKSQALLPKDKTLSSHSFASFSPGSIDYTPCQESIRMLLEAMDKKRICKITYRAIMSESLKTFYIKPLKIFSHHDTIYLHAGMARKPGETYKEPDFDPLLAMHRIKNVELTERMFEFPEKYDFEKIFNQDFGIIKDDTFRVEVEFTGWSAKYVAERIWSPDQKIIKKADGTTRLIFSSSSESELTGWALSFADEARVVKPKWLVEKVSQTIKRMEKVYS
ncbi:MAG TPA: WYL domain-containing protein, partial [Candidatus Bathyarchaeia archaeon]|nr:WYL domain-containing protein [Candidatus Bathyarchaeia archaeon]